MITNVSFLKDSQLSIFHDGVQTVAEDTEENRERLGLNVWLDQGNSITAYVAPPPPTDEDRIDAAFSPSDKDRVFFEAIFELRNRQIALEAGTAITRAQLRDWLKAKLP